jgi:small multidrug resistance pump
MNGQTMTYLMLLVAIIGEVAATSALKSADGFTRFWPSVIVVVGYATAFYFLSLTVRVIPVGIVYAIWSGVGIALIALVGWLVLDQKLDMPAIAGIVMITSGVMVISLFSGSMHE